MKPTFSLSGTALKPAALAMGISLLLLPTASAWAHAFLNSANPAVGSTVKVSPVEVRITFSEIVEPTMSSLKVFDPGGKEVDRKDVHADPKDHHQLVVSLLASLGSGTYKVSWRAVSQDTHVTKGEFTFRMEP